MLDPIGGFRRIQNFIINYIETSFRISNKSVASERRKLLETVDVLATEPFIEPVLRYEPYSQTLEELALRGDGPLAPLSQEGKRAFVELALSGLFEGENCEGHITRKSIYKPYDHQIVMLSRGLLPGHPGIVTSRTGSGKTESFMLPVLAAISNEAVTWRKPAADFLKNAWWNEEKAPWSPKRIGEVRSSAVRCLVIYPMNALVEDQMQRLRKSLDSDEARKVMTDRFQGNRIFFGQYTSSTPVTGFEHHPRMAEDKDERQRRARRLARLRESMRSFKRNQDAAFAFDAQMDNKTPHDKTRFIFPATDGGEMLSRWDMQFNPPDILITNASMLSTMLSREVEESIFSKTRDWLHSDNDAYFYLVFDELHLIRGSAGTETAFLVKTLIQRLGLEHPAQKHKLRLLASSASLPTEGEQGIQSLTYLRDLFAPYGASQYAHAPDITDINFWRESIVVGKPYLPPSSINKIQPQPFIRLYEAAKGDNESLVTKISDPTSLSPFVEDAARALGLSEIDLVAQIKALAESAASELTRACIEGNDVRATSVSNICKRLFQMDGSDLDKALRGLLLARALPEAGVWPSSIKVSSTTPAFRVHTFIRNVEGLFASVKLNGTTPLFGDFTVERGITHAMPNENGSHGRRLFELLYCEACGDLLIGGQRGQKLTNSDHTELLPISVDLENLPEKLGSEYYDKMSLEEFAVFWPSRAEPSISERDYDSWVEASLNPETGLVSTNIVVPPGHVGGYLYHQKDGAVMRKGKISGPLMAQPFCCPKCGTDYSFRPVSSRSRSPIRAFRTGVTKTSQLVATELFELLHAIGADPKGIVFSDSRQDAANQALEIETLHLRDLRREILVTAARQQARKASADWIEIDQLQKLVIAADGNQDEIARITTKFSLQHTSGVTKSSGKVPLGKLLQSGAATEIGALTSELVSLGIHPFDRIGKKRYEGHYWPNLFEKKGNDVTFSTKLNDSQIAGLNKEILEAQYELIDDVIFANTFFALEETGLAYPSVKGDESNTTDFLDAWLRIFAGAYRVLDNKYVHGDKLIEWVSGLDVRNKRVQRFAKAIFGADSIEKLTEVLRNFSEIGHPNGMIHLGKLYLKITKEDDDYWRCSNCERIHLHWGPGRCTRCCEGLNREPTGKVIELWRNNFLGSRIVRGQEEEVGRFRLRIEELTGQTDDFSDRLRKFKGIFVEDESQIEKAAQEIDMLSVTTTMEVGIDIGALQSVYQANMPPQRFNYQQRVGRAGRRGQAFSLVITFCRGRSHDAYYFAHPHAITGDPPPPPFLAINHDPIPLRLVRKNWLHSAFAVLRKQCAESGEQYPGDRLKPPDVHGEYVSTHDYFYDEHSNWSARLSEALKLKISERDAFIDTASFDEAQRNRLRNQLHVSNLIKEIDSLKKFAPNSSMGLARFLAEWGLLPMYGMPTRVRNLYLGLRTTNSGDENEYDWSIMDRDLDLAVFEFSPGAVLVKDKQKHKVVGFSGVLSIPETFKKTDVSIKTMSDWCEAKMYVALCQSCGSAKRSDEQPKDSMLCDDCAGEITLDTFAPYITPAGFRTDFNPKDEEESSGMMSVRSMATLMNTGANLKSGSTTILHGASVTIMQMNDGISDIEGKGQGFEIEEALDLSVPIPSASKKNVSIDGSQAFDATWLKKARSNNIGQMRWGKVDKPSSNVRLISCKQTESIHLQLDKFDPRLDLSHVTRKGQNVRLPVRAAAISATQILVQRAAIELDVSAEEFEALEPRLRFGKPMLQIADALINGSGLSRRLGENSIKSKRPQILDMLDDILVNQEKWPLLDCLKTSIDGDHALQCHTSCYKCIQRYGNRRYHGLLDWRLGLAYLRAMTTPDYACGLETTDSQYPEIRGWYERAQWLSRSLEQMRPDYVRSGTFKHSGLPYLDETINGVKTRYVLTHPLWSLESSILATILREDWDPSLRFLDTFNLERRPLRAMDSPLFPR